MSRKNLSLLFACLKFKIAFPGGEKKTERRLSTNLVEIRAGNLPAIEFDAFFVFERSQALGFEVWFSLQLERAFFGIQKKELKEDPSL